VRPGAVLASLRNVPLQSGVEYTRARLSMASERAKDASLHYADFGLALKEKEGLTNQLKHLSDMESALQITSPIAGTVMTPRADDLLGSTVKEGQELFQIADLASMRARIYISEYDLYKIRQGAGARLQVQGMLRTWSAQIASMAARPTELDARLLGKVELQGMNPPHFYVADLLVQNPDGILKPGMTGIARIYGRRRSLFGLGVETFLNFFGRKVW
jgi:HlyD family secretion protein